MATREQPSNNKPKTGGQWWLPFLWIVLTPIIAVPLSAILFFSIAGYLEAGELGRQTGRHSWDVGGCEDGPYTDCTGWGASEFRYSEITPTVAAFTLPGLIYLVPFLWLLSRQRRVKAAAALSGLLGVLCGSIPPSVLKFSDSAPTVAGANGGSYFRFVTDGWFAVASEPFDSVWTFGFLAWLGSLLAWAIFALALAAVGRSGKLASTIGLIALAITGALTSVGGGTYLVIVMVVAATMEGHGNPLPLFAVGLAFVVAGGAVLRFSYRRLRTRPGDAETGAATFPERRDQAPAARG